MNKPAYVFDRDVEWDGLINFVTSGGPGLELGVVSGRRRQGKTLLLNAVRRVAGGFMFGAAESTEADSLRQLGEAYARHLGFPAQINISAWEQALGILLPLDERENQPRLVIFDEFPYLAAASPALPSILQRHIDRHRMATLESETGQRQPSRLILCGSALSFMGKLLSGTAPLRGRAGFELVVPTLDYRKAAAFWGITDPRLAVLVYAIVGGTPAYRREFVRDDTPQGIDDFDAWVCRTVLNPQSPLFREARYLLAEEPNLRDSALFHSVLAAVAEGNSRRGGIASYIGRRSGDIGHPLAVLQDAGLLRRDDDALARNRTTYRVAEPLIAFYHSVMRPVWSGLENAAGMPQTIQAVWAGSQARFIGKIVGPQFEHICRVWAAHCADPALFTVTGQPPAIVQVGSTIVNDSAAHTSHEVDVLVMAPPDGNHRRVLSIGEVKWGTVMGLPHLERLRRVRDVLAARTDVDARDAVPACYSGAGFTDDLRREADAGRVLLVGLAELYAKSTR